MEIGIVFWNELEKTNQELYRETRKRPLDKSRTMELVIQRQDMLETVLMKFVERVGKENLCQTS